MLRLRKSFMPTDPSSRIIRFSTFELNLETGELRERGQKVKLQEQPLQVLAALLEAGCRVLETLGSRARPPVAL